MKILILGLFTLVLVSFAKSDDIDVCKAACETSGSGCGQFGLNLPAVQLAEPIRATYVTAVGPDGLKQTFCGRITKKYLGTITNRGKDCYTNLDLGERGHFTIHLHDVIISKISKTTDNKIKIEFDPAMNFSFYNYDKANHPQFGGDLVYISTFTDPNKKEIMFWETTDGRCFSAPVRRN